MIFTQWFTEWPIGVLRLPFIWCEIVQIRNSQNSVIERKRALSRVLINKSWLSTMTECFYRLLCHIWTLLLSAALHLIIQQESEGLPAGARYYLALFDSFIEPKSPYIRTSMGVPSWNLLLVGFNLILDKSHPTGVTMDVIQVVEMIIWIFKYWTQITWQISNIKIFQYFIWSKFSWICVGERGDCL